MGLFSSKPKPEPKPKPETPLLDEPWREINWSDRQGALQAVNNFRPQTEDQQIRILLHGPVGAGKSSFINSVQSVLLGRMYKLALVDNVSHGCFTKKYNTYKIQKGTADTFYPFVLNDMMGVKHVTRRNRRIHVKDVKRVMKGHVKDGYTFNPECKLSKDNRFYNKSPGPNDKVHVLVSVIDANKISLMPDEVLMTLQDLRDEASELGIPQVAILTKIDEACPETKKNVRNVYKSKVLQEKIQKFSADVGIPLDCIFPVKNYHSETILNDDIDTLILSTLKLIVDCGNDFLNKKSPY